MSSTNVCHVIREWLGDEKIEWVLNLGRNKIYSKSRFNSYARQNPNWEYCRLVEEDIFILKFEYPLLQLLPTEKYSKISTIIDSADGRLIDSQTIKNYISKQLLTKADRIAAILGIDEENVIYLPTESHLFIVAADSLIGISGDCSYASYLRGREKVIQSLNETSKYLLPPISFVWNTKVDDEEFEKLVLELVTREPGVIRARKIGQGNEPDVGRDILAEWHLPQGYRNASSDQPIVLRRVVIQCKAYNSPVGKSKVNDLVDLLDFHDSTAYLLVALSGVTKPLIDYLEKLGKRPGYWSDWWTRIELEDKLRQNRDIALRYAHIVVMKTPQ